MKIGIVLQLFGLSQHVRLLLQYHHVPDRHLQCKIYDKQIFRKKFTLEKDSFMPFDQNYSFPSNHIASTTAFSFIIGGIAYKRYPLFAKTFFISFPILIGITKLYLLQQFFSDIIAGSILGLMIITLIIKFTKIEEKEKDKIKEKE